VAALQREVSAIDKDQPLTNIKTLDEVIADSVAQRRFPALLLLLFAFVALVLTMIGIYGVISYSVSQRTAEIGIRVALGARPGDVLRLVLRQALWLIGVGITGGLLGAYALSRYLSSLLFSITAADPPTYGVVAVMLAVVALFACYAPARRAARVDPVVALRCD
jgi:putative ABC transport system permease protein